jgi:NAD-dependent deacetylase
VSNASIVQENIGRAAALLRKAKSVVVFTGAGVSAESGVPTYRSGADALWSRQNMERFANPPGYRANLPESYDWYRARARGVSEVQPNAGHRAIVELAAFVPKLSVVTQNIDSLHQRAGSVDVIELHGSLRHFRCDSCGQLVAWDATPDAPACGTCSGMLRPGVVMFYENLPEHALEMARYLAEHADVLLSVGTSNQVWPAAELPQVTLSAGGSVIIVNPDLEGQPLHRHVIGIPGAAGVVLPAIVGLMTTGGDHPAPPEGSRELERETKLSQD